MRRRKRAGITGLPDQRCHVITTGRHKDLWISFEAFQSNIPFYPAVGYRVSAGASVFFMFPISFLSMIAPSAEKRPSYMAMAPP